MAVCGLMSLGFGLWGFSKNRRNPLNTAWFAFSIAVSCWAFSSFLLRFSTSENGAFLWSYTGHIAFAFIPVFFFKFVLNLSQPGATNSSFVTWNMVFAALFTALIPTPLFLNGVRVDPSGGFYPTAGLFYGVFALWFVAVYTAAIWILLRSYRAQSGRHKNQLLYMVLASLFGMAGLCSVFPAVWEVAPPPGGMILILFYLLVGYSMIRWKLLNVSIVIKNTLIYASLYSILVGLFVVFVVFLGQFLFYGPQALDRRVLWMCAVALSVVTVVVRPLDHWLTKATDALLYQRRFEWQKTLKEASRGMAKATSIDRLLKMMAHFIGMRVRVSHVGILYRNSTHYILKVSRGKEKCPVGMNVDRDNPLVTWLEEKKEILSLDEIMRWLNDERMFPPRSVFRRNLLDVRTQMETLHSRICVPAFSKSQLLGFLVLGDKLSGEPYRKEDLDLLTTLANEGAIALENAQLYEQLYQRMSEIEKLYEREHQLFIHTAIALAAAVDARDPYTHGHTERCTAYSLVIAGELASHPEVRGFQRFKETLKIAALLHDIGKIGIPDDILGKKGKLTPKEFKKMEEHSIVGAIILQPIKGMEEVAKAVKAHHERYDGRGYPDGLRGMEIPLMTRIISVADTFDAMTTDRPYRKHLADSVAVEEIEGGSGTQFDPVVVDAFLKAYRKGLITMRPVEATDMLR
ncbi:MAG: HD domain-containing protein [Candidatus Omnitrophica bacterium]|nr:HD domain-containing protein [Candidatus Omnitrophota bacterium]